MEATSSLANVDSEKATLGTERAICHFTNFVIEIFGITNQIRSIRDMSI